MSLKIAGLLVAGALLAGRASAQTSAVPLASVRGTGLTDSEKLEKSGEHLDRMKASLRQVLGRVEEARNEKDVVKLNCVNEKLTQIKALLKVAEQADISLHESIANKDQGADTEFSKIGIAGTKIEALRGDAQQCIGQLAYVVDERTTVEVQQPDGLPQRDVTSRFAPRSPWVTPPVVRRPPNASRYY
ncbi:hypothetical protein [Anaeromyxobacter oryzae]|uniref:Uncharacterized protein n=1 Tax=Anaeromyxobacter oryzae TaxID=2918170 RepID=A0ABM7WSS1_9BACT|nr:hypothetical protein [Anaeromyxobacter oryzae]BDG02534.1 hypothetical protein AMOR_15300 [Anaeromyxobacter oryzae]